MDSVHWVIQENQGDDDGLRELVEALHSEGHVTHLVWFTKGDEIPAIPNLPSHVPIVCYGPALVKRTAHHPRLKSGLFFDEENFRWSALCANWGKAMLSDDGEVVPLSAADEELRQRGPLFVRPDSDSKVFEGRVYNATDFANAHRTIVNHLVPVVVATPIPVDMEWRFFIVDREIVGCSEYRQSGKYSITAAVPQRAIEFAGDVAARWSPAAVYCLDVGTSGERLGVIEVNCFNGSRFYGAPKIRILRAVNDYVLRHT
jgi:ATP-grasp domain, R2K clade family 3